MCFQWLQKKTINQFKSSASTLHDLKIKAKFMSNILQEVRWAHVEPVGDPAYCPKATPVTKGY